MVIQDGTPEAFEAYLAVYTVAPYAPRVRALFERRQEMIAWYTAVTVNTVASFEMFLARYPNSDLATTARRLMERARNRSLASLAAVTPTCACTAPTTPATPRIQPPPAREKKVEKPKKEKVAKRTTEKPEKKKKSSRGKDFVSDEEMSRGGRPVSSGGGGGGGAPPISIGIGFGGGRMPMGGGRSHTAPVGRSCVERRALSLTIRRRYGRVGRLAVTTKSLPNPSRLLYNPACPAQRWKRRQNALAGRSIEHPEGD